MALNKIFRPFFVNDLIRIGNRSDGGYIISKKIMRLAENVITFGLFDEFSFEKHIKNLKKNIKIICFDHTVGHFFWFKHLCKWIFFSIRYRSFELFKRSMSFLSYYYFFFIRLKIFYHIIALIHSLSTFYYTIYFHMIT